MHLKKNWMVLRKNSLSLVALCPPGDKNGGVNMSTECVTVTPLPLTRVERQPVGHRAKRWVGGDYGGVNDLLHVLQ